jgi:hypothetical protein
MLLRVARRRSALGRVLPAVAVPDFLASATCYAELTAECGQEQTLTANDRNAYACLGPPHTSNHHMPITVTAEEEILVGKLTFFR